MDFLLDVFVLACTYYLHDSIAGVHEDVDEEVFELRRQRPQYSQCVFLSPSHPGVFVSVLYMTNHCFVLAANNTDDQDCSSDDSGTFIEPLVLFGCSLCQTMY